MTDPDALTDPMVRAIEARMRPGALSDAGFLAAGQPLCDVIATDRATLAANGVTAHQIAGKLRWLLGRAERRLELREREAPHIALPPRIDVDHFEVSWTAWLGGQSCPFLAPDGSDSCPEVYGSRDYLVTNRSSQESIAFPGLAPHLIGTHAFFQGDTPYRVEPAQLLAVLEITRDTGEAPHWIQETTWRPCYEGPFGAVDVDHYVRRHLPHVLDDPDDILEPCEGVRLLVHGDDALLLARHARPLPPLLVGSVRWPWRRVRRGTYHLRKHTQRVIDDR